MHRWSFIALAALAAGTAGAQETERSAPTDPRAKVPGVEYHSAFAGYGLFAEQKVTPWRESNEAVKGGGHPAPSLPDPVAKPPSSAEHGGHR